MLGKAHMSAGVYHVVLSVVAEVLQLSKHHPEAHDFHVEQQLAVAEEEVE